MNTFFRIFILLLICTSCASTYKPLVPSSLSYPPPKEMGQLKVSFVMNPQQLSGNVRYSKKEDRHQMRSIALKIENRSSDTITFTRENLEIESLNGKRVVVDPSDYSKFVRQRVGAHLLHALYGPWAISWQQDNSTGETDVDFIYIPIGAIVGIGNAVRASNANKQNIATQTQYQILNKKILPGQTIYGLLIVSASPSDDLTISVR